MSETLIKPSQIEILYHLRNKIPFLQQIPDHIYFRLDTSEFLIPKDEIATTRIDLEIKLRQYVMTYRRNTFNLSIPPENHLCANIKGAELSMEQIILLQDAERQLVRKEVSFVAYQNPMELLDPRQTTLYDLYMRRGLLVNNE